MARILLFILLFFGSVVHLFAQTWVASPQVIGKGRGGETIRGVVFDDRNKNGLLDRGERGVEGVRVSNGLDWVTTDARGAYEIAVRDDMNLTIVQPSGWRVPTDHRMVPQFFYIHKPAGTGYPMRFGGLPPTGPAPERVNFPLSREGAALTAFSCAVVGDPQTYNNQQLEWLRDGVIADITAGSYKPGDCLIMLGDVVGDDLGLLDRLLEITSVSGLPAWLVLGNHDIDFDAKSNNEKADSWRRLYGPHYYAFEQGNVLFVVLDNVFYPCGEEDAARGRRNCEAGRNPSYNGKLTETQFQWLEGLIRNTPEERLIVFNSHIPFVSFVDAGGGQHQTDEISRIYALAEGRRALSFSGHTHTSENHAPGQYFEGWKEHVGAGPLPFRHIIAAAASGAWYQGDFNVDGVPMALQRMGAPMGYYHLDFTGTEYQERYVGARLGPHRAQWVSLNTPAFREWFNTIVEWGRTTTGDRDPVPPLSVNDLPDLKVVLPADFTEGVWLTANIWAGSAETRAEVRLPDGSVVQLERTQQGTGEAARIGAEWADPFAAVRQLTVARYAYQSRSGDERAQGFEVFRGTALGPAAPQPQRSLADRNMHLWRVRLPELPLGVHKLVMTSTDRHGIRSSDTITIEVRAERPPRYWRRELWE